MISNFLDEKVLHSPLHRPNHGDNWGHNELFVTLFFIEKMR